MAQISTDVFELGTLGTELNHVTINSTEFTVKMPTTPTDPVASINLTSGTSLYGAGGGSINFFGGDGDATPGGAIRLTSGAASQTFSWTSRVNAFTNIINDVTYDLFNDIFVAVGQTGELETSDVVGTTYTARTTSFSPNNINAISSENGQFIAVGTGGALETSSNVAVTWTVRTSSFGTSSISDVAHDPAHPITGVVSGGAGTGSFDISGDTTKFATAGVVFTVSGSTGNDGTYTVRAPGSTFAFGTTTIPVVEAVPSGVPDGSIAPTWIAVGAGGKIARSIDNGITWTQQTSPFGTDTVNGVTHNLQPGTFTPALWVAVSSAGKIANSPTGVTWTLQTTPPGIDNLRRVRFASNVWVAVGGGGVPAITGVVSGGAGTASFDVLTDLTGIFTTGFTFTVSNSAGNTGSYTVRSPGSTFAAGTTTIPVVEAVPSAVADGFISLTNVPVTGVVMDITSPFTGSFNISGDRTRRFVTGEQFTVFGSTGNDGTYTVRAPGSTFAAGTTTIPVVEAVPSAVADGFIRLPKDNIVSSPDGSAWTRRVTPFSNTVGYLATGYQLLANLWLASTEDTALAFSLNGSITWIDTTTFLGAPGYGLAHRDTFPGLWVAVESAPFVQTSPNHPGVSLGSGANMTVGGGGPQNLGEGFNNSGGPIFITSGAGGTDSGFAGPIELTGGMGGSVGGHGGHITLTGGVGASSGAGGNIEILGGAGGITIGNGGNVSLRGGIPSNGAGGNIQLIAQPGVGTDRTGGTILIQGNDGTGTANGGFVEISAGGTTSGNNGDIRLITAFSPSTSTAGRVIINAQGGYSVTRSGEFTGTGDAQSNEYVLRARTTTAAVTEMFLDTTQVTVGTKQMLIPFDTSWAFEIHVIARRTDSDNESAEYLRKGAIDKNGTNASTALVAAVQTLGTDIEDSAAWDIAVTADTATGALKISVTGEAAKIIRWVAFVRTVEVTG